MNKLKKLLALVAGFAALAAAPIASAQAVIPAEIEEIIDQTGLVWTPVKTMILAVVGFMILVGFLKMIKRH